MTYWKRFTLCLSILMLCPSSVLAQHELTARRPGGLGGDHQQYSPSARVFVNAPQGRNARALRIFTSDLDREWGSRRIAEFDAGPDERWKSINQGLRRSTLAGLWIATSLGTIGIINRPTLFGEGRCETGGPILGEYGCGPSTTLHGITAATSVVLFTASEVITLTTGDMREYSRARRVLTWVTRAGMMALPLVGIVSRFPDVIGINDPENQRAFGRTVRTLHAGAGYVTVAAYTATFFLD